MCHFSVSKVAVDVKNFSALVPLIINTVNDWDGGIAQLVER